MTAVYRVRQFLLAVMERGRRREDVEWLVTGSLPPAAARLFWAMPRYDRHHALRVAQTLWTEKHTDPDLLAAALLHDVGKTAGTAGRLRLWHRVAVVLMQSLWPGLLDRIGQNRPGSWRHPFFVQKHHAALGAELARGVGCSAATVELIRRHEDRAGGDGYPGLAALQAADSAN